MFQALQNQKTDKTADQIVIWVVFLVNGQVICQAF